MPSSSVTSSPMNTGKPAGEGGQRHHRRDRAALVGAALGGSPRPSLRACIWKLGRQRRHPLRPRPPQHRPLPHRAPAGSAARSRAPCAPPARRGAAAANASASASSPGGSGRQVRPLQPGAPGAGRSAPPCSPATTGMMPGSSRVDLLHRPAGDHGECPVQLVAQPRQRGRPGRCGTTTESGVGAKSSSVPSMSSSSAAKLRANGRSAASVAADKADVVDRVLEHRHGRLVGEHPAVEARRAGRLS